MGVAHTRVTIRGKLSSGAESWSTGFSTPPVIGATVGDMEDLAQLAITRWVADFIGGASAWIPLQVTAEGAIAQQVNASGHVTVSGESVLTTPAEGGGSGNQLPPECAVVVSLRTGTSGPRGRGRMYLPPVTVGATTTTGMLSTTARSSILAAMQDFFNTWNSDPSTLTASVASNAGVFVEAISNIRVGNVIDAQRRRRDRIVESYATAAITI